MATFTKIAFHEALAKKRTHVFTNHLCKMVKNGKIVHAGDHGYRVRMFNPGAITEREASKAVQPCALLWGTQATFQVYGLTMGLSAWASARGEHPGSRICNVEEDPYAVPAEEATEQPAKSARVAELLFIWGRCKHCSTGGCKINKKHALCFLPFWERKGRKKKGSSEKACGTVARCIGSNLLSLISWTWIICASPEKCWPTLHSIAWQMKHTANTPTKKMF